MKEGMKRFLFPAIVAFLGNCILAHDHCSQRSSLRSECSSPCDQNLSIYNFTEPDLFESKNVTLDEFTGQQEPGGYGEEIYNGIKYIRPGGGFEPNFPLFRKVQVNGDEENALYTYLKIQCPVSPRSEYMKTSLLFYSPIRPSDIRWNFEKFLIDKNGYPRFRYDGNLSPEHITEDITLLLSE